MRSTFIDLLFPKISLTGQEGQWITDKEREEIERKEHVRDDVDARKHHRNERDKRQE